MQDGLLRALLPSLLPGCSLGWPCSSVSPGQPLWNAPRQAVVQQLSNSPSSWSGTLGSTCTGGADAETAGSGVSTTSASRPTPHYTLRHRVSSASLCCCMLVLCRLVMLCLTVRLLTAGVRRRPAAPAPRTSVQAVASLGTPSGCSSAGTARPPTTASEPEPTRLAVPAHQQCCWLVQWSSLYDLPRLLGCSAGSQALPSPTWMLDKPANACPPGPGCLLGQVPCSSPSEEPRPAGPPAYPTCWVQVRASRLRQDQAAHPRGQAQGAADLRALPAQPHLAACVWPGARETACQRSSPSVCRFCILLWAGSSAAPLLGGCTQVCRLKQAVESRAGWRLGAAAQAGSAGSSNHAQDPARHENAGMRGL